MLIWESFQSPGVWEAVCGRRKAVQTRLWEDGTAEGLGVGDRGSERERSGLKIKRIKGDPFPRDGYGAGVGRVRAPDPTPHPSHAHPLCSLLSPAGSIQSPKLYLFKPTAHPAISSPGLAPKSLLPEIPSFLQLQSGKSLLSFNYLSGIRLQDSILDTFIHPIASARFIIPLTSLNTLCLFIAALITWYFLKDICLLIYLAVLGLSCYTWDI